MVTVKITMTNNGTLETFPHSYESQDDFCKRVNEIIKLSFEIEDRRLTDPDEKKLKVAKEVQDE